MLHLNHKNLDINPLQISKMIIDFSLEHVTFFKQMLSSGANTFWNMSQFGNDTFHNFLSIYTIWQQNKFFGTVKF